MYYLLITVPFCCVIILNVLFKTVVKRAALWFGIALSASQVCFVVFNTFYSKNKSIDIISPFFKFNFMVDSLSRVMLICIGIVLFVTVLVARYIIRNENDRFNFANLTLIALTGMNGMVMAKDIFSLYVFLEITAVVSFILIAFDKDIFALEGAFKYIILSAISTIMVLSSIALLLLMSGSTEFSVINSALKTSPDTFLIMFTMGIFICGLFIKAGLMPFHGWLPDAYSAAPNPVSLLLAGIVTKTVGVYTLMRITISVFGFNDSIKHILLLVGAFSVVFGALAAMGQSDFKRMLAYSSISQVGYIILGLGCGTTLGLAGAVFHLFNHSVFKSLLFLNSAAVELQTGTRDMNKMSGLASKMPLTGITSVLASLSTAGIPPLSGFWSKLVIIIALWMSGYHGYAIIAILASVVTLAYLLSMQRRVFFGVLSEDFSNIKEVGLGLLFPAVILALIIIGVGIFFPFILNIFILPVGNLIGG